MDREAPEAQPAGIDRDVARGYLRGKGVARDPARGAALLQKACDAGEMLGCTELGAVYQRGGGAPATLQPADPAQP